MCFSHTAIQSVVSKYEYDILKQQKSLSKTSLTFDNTKAGIQYHTLYDLWHNWTKLPLEHTMQSRGHWWTLVRV